ncbi:MAG: DVU0298 family protein [Bacillota bacterium]
MTNKQLIKELLEEQKYGQLVKIAGKKHSQTLKYIQMNLFGDINESLRWSALEAIGRLTREYAPKETEVYKNLIRRFLWAMNDESGNVPWSSPEGIGIIIANQPFLFGEYTPMLITNAMDNPMCHRGMLWAAGKIGSIRPSLVVPFMGYILPFLEEEDIELRAYAAWALGEISCKDALPRLKNLDNLEGKVNIYREGKLSEVSIASLINESIGKIELAS